MCGIYAKFRKHITASEIQLSPSLKRRGPDASEILQVKNGVLGFTRLAINDCSSLGMQPFQEGKVSLVCNGEIYNYKELIQTFNLTCKSNSDCEVILHLYKKIGFVETVKQLYGVFAFVLVDDDVVYVSRDRIGVRPLYFSSNYRDEITFSSTAEGLNKPNQWLPGTSSVIRDYKPVVLYEDKYSLPFFQRHVEEKEIRETLIAAVKTRLVSDRPIACLLSGGLDSSIITAILVSLLGSENVRTYSIGMEGSTDLKYARIVADHLKTKHTEVIFTPEEGIQAIPQVIQAIETYDITTIRASVGMYLVSKYIKENTKDTVIFSGEGSDELLLGYLYFHKAPSPLEAELEGLRLVRELYKYDVRRADGCISSNGLEPRVPFLDRKFVNLTLEMRAEDKVPIKNIEKYWLRKAFENWLPSEVLWRRKEGFSDGVSCMQKPWYAHIQEYVEAKIGDEIFDTKYPSKEAMYYRLIFNKLFPLYDLNVKYWMPKWSGDLKDPSGRLITL